MMRLLHGSAMHKLNWFVAGVLAACSPPPVRSAGMSAEPRSIAVLDTVIAYRDVGAGRPIVFLHGNPTSSHVWRNVIPRFSSDARCLAPDLAGMGRSGKPDSAYRLADHARYLDAWFAELDLRDVVLVGYDWGGVLALDWAARHPDRVRGVVVFETFLRPMRWSDWSPEGARLFRALRTPGVGEQLVLEKNEFLARSLAHGVQRGLAERDRQAYYAPFPDAASRRPMLQWLVDWARATFSTLEIVPLGRAGHHAPEDAPDAIADAIRGWLGRHSLSAVR
jgi:haloalkane dehalogenase